MLFNSGVSDLPIPAASACTGERMRSSVYPAKAKEYNHIAEEAGRFEEGIE